MQRIVTFLWFDKEAEEAANLYVSIFPNSKVTNVGRSGEAGPGDKGRVMSVEFVLDGQEFFALNGGSHFHFTEAISLFVKCETQREVDYYWTRLLDGGGKESQCGWLKDRYCLSWQIVPSVLGRYLRDPDPEKSRRTMQAMLKMVKLDIAALTAAYEGR